MAGEAPIKFREISWEGPVVVPGPVPHGYRPSDDGVDPADGQEAVDSPATPSGVELFRSASTIREAIARGGIRDSLELKKYQPPNPLGIRRASNAIAAAMSAPYQASAAAGSEESVALPVGGKEPATQTQTFTFRVPATMLSGDAPRRRGGPSHALNVVQPYPNPSGLRKKRAAPINLGPLPERLLKRQRREISVSHLPDGSTMVIKALDEELQQELKAGGDKGAEESSWAAGRRFSAVEDMVRKMRKDKAKDKAVPAQEDGDATKQQGVKAEVTGKHKGGKLKRVEFGESAYGKEGNLYGDQQVGGAKEVRDGEQPVNSVKTVRKVKAVRDLRKAFARILKVTPA